MHVGDGVKTVVRAGVGFRAMNVGCGVRKSSGVVLKFGLSIIADEISGLDFTHTN
jgi:hypothetical protein